MQPTMDLEGQRLKSTQQAKTASDDDLLGTVVNMGRYLRQLEMESKEPHPMLVVAFEVAKAEALERGLAKAISASVNN